MARRVALTVWASVGLLLFAACGSSSSSPEPGGGAGGEAGSDHAAGNGDSGEAVGGASGDRSSGVSGGGIGGDGGAGDRDSGATPGGGGEGATTSGVVSFEVPEGGGTIDVEGSQKYSFEFPADSAGETFSIQLVTSEAAGFKPGRFRDVFLLGPNGTVFATPVHVRPADPVEAPSFVQLYPEPWTPKTVELAFLQDGAYNVKHFSKLAVPAVRGLDYCDKSFSPGFGLDSCLPWTPTGSGTPVPMPGHTHLNQSCDVSDMCGYWLLQCCPATAQGVAADLCHESGDGFSNVHFVPQGCVDMAPTGCGLPVGVSIGATGCGAGATCDGASIRLDCDDTTCSCTGGSGASFPRGSTCDSGGNLSNAVYDHCR